MVDKLTILIALLSAVSVASVAAAAASSAEAANFRKFQKTSVRDSITRLSSDGDLNITYETKWFTQLVDHFTWANQDTWRQRFLVNTDHWCGQNCPILFYTGNEGDIEVFTNNTGWMWENAESLHAMLVFAEHRFYGQSMPYDIDPTKIRPDELAKLGFLSSEQALADFARLVYELKNTIYDAKHSPVIAIGGSYGGMLAGWMRMKYPNLIAGALAGSAPILQFVGEYDCKKFMQIVTKDYEMYSPNCSALISRSWSSMRAVAAKEQGLAKLKQIFNTCDSLKKEDVDYLNEMLSSIWVNMAMTDYANPASFLSKMPAYPIKHSCHRLNGDPVASTDEQVLQMISAASQIYTNTTGDLKCLDFKSFIFDPMDVLWDFQSCTEMVMPICSNGIDDMFDPAPFNVSDFVQQCSSRWGVHTHVNKIQTLYGNERLDGASNIIFSSCSRDPWSAGCPQTGDESKGVYALKIPGVCHHEDLRPSGSNDPSELKQARVKELAIITGWIQEHYDRLHKILPEESLVWTKHTVSN